MIKGKNLYFVIGTEAELIKMFPTMLILNEKRIPYKIIATGQNNIKKSPFLKLVNGGVVNVDITGKTVRKKSAFGLLSWYFTTENNGKRVLKKIIKKPKETFFVLHGDTLSTVMGARLAKYLKVPYAHVEAGYRSWNYLCPFPEEFDRTYASINADLIFVAGENLIKNLGKNEGKKINTYYNTVLDSLNYSLQNNHEDVEIDGKYFVFSIHRQENLLNYDFLKKTIKNVNDVAKNLKCVMFMHPQTEEALKKFNLLLELKKPNIIIYPRVSYFKFLKIVEGSKFVITDGAGNQQELYYLGKPCLLLRYKTEGTEGLGQNILLFRGDFDMIKIFAKEYKKYSRKKIKTKKSPSQIIADEIEKYEL